MLLDGNLKQFPLPEVLLFLGPRTGRLRIYDVPKYAVMDVDLALGQAHSLHLGGIQLTEMNEMVAELSVIVETGEGRFEFIDQQVDAVPRERPLPVSDLVMAMVIHVNQKLSQKRAAFLPEDLYVAQIPAPEIWIDHSLNVFFLASLEWLTNGVQTNQLAEKLGLEHDAVLLNLTYLRQLGFVKIVDPAQTEAARHRKLRKDISEKTDKYEFAAEASDLVMRTGKLIMRTGHLWKAPSTTPLEIPVEAGKSAKLIIKKRASSSPSR